MANSWSIIIKQMPDGTVSFTPDVPGAIAGQPLGVSAGDLVTWNNRTNQQLELRSIPPGTFLTQPIPAGSASSPIFSVAKSVIYSCVSPTQHQHSIVIVS